MTAFKRFAKGRAIGPIALRGGIVALNFAVMLGLAVLLGLATFGELVVLWGLALVAGTVLSLGGPLLLLRHLTDGQGLHPQTLLFQVLILPLVLAVAAFFLLGMLFPELQWSAILGAGVAINLVTCLASVMRGLGSVNASMALRDAAPQIALGAAAVMASTDAASSILIGSVAWLGAISAVVGIWCLRHAKWKGIVKTNGAQPQITWSLWSTSVLGMGLAQVDIILGGSLLSPEQIGVYALLRRIANLVALPVSVATWVSAGPVSAAYGADDRQALQIASARGSEIAFLPGLALFVLGLCALPMLDIIAGAALGIQGHGVFILLLVAALIQVFFAASYTVATLCAQAHVAAIARFFSIAVYMGVVCLAGPALIGPLENAASYAVATSLGTVVLWLHLRQKLQIDTSALALRHKPEVTWNLS